MSDDAHNQWIDVIQVGPSLPHPLAGSSAKADELKLSAPTGAEVPMLLPAVNQVRMTAEPARPVDAFDFIPIAGGDQQTGLELEPVIISSYNINSDGGELPVPMEPSPDQIEIVGDNTDSFEFIL